MKRLMGALLVCAAAPAASADDALFEPWPSVAKVDLDDTALTALVQDKASSSIELVSVDAAKVTTDARVLTFPLAPGLVVQFHRKDAYTTDDGMVVWYGLASFKGRGQSTDDGEIDDDPLDSAMLVQNGEKVTGNIHYGHRMFALRPLHDAPHALVEVDQRMMPPDHPAEFKSLPEVPMGAGAGAKAISTIRVMVVITSSAMSASGDASGLINLAIAETNKGYTNSGVEISMVKAGAYSTTYRESGSFSTDLSRFRGTSDGYMDSFHATRNSIAADVMMLIINNSSSCGLASGIGSTASTAFAVAHWSCSTGYYSFGHEIGHLQSARHDP
ncbi:MAG TPA: M12 family metallo-peptidase, partial [Xanthomonadales bacterium]|nr:M12 family metallo-peptidase [Xanthomonadales bacterium]